MKKNGKPYNPFQSFEKNHDFESRINLYKSFSYKKILSQDEFIDLGKAYDKNVIEEQ